MIEVIKDTKLFEGHQALEVDQEFEQDIPITINFNWVLAPPLKE